ncbi:30S ribosomal protein S6 [Candidatus Margulisiibacteriota bacterium]
MKKYEAICVFNPTVEEDKRVDLTSKIEKKITDLGGKIEKVDKIGVKRLETPFKKHNTVKEGYYIGVYFEAESDLPTKLVAHLRIIEELMRYSLIASKVAKAEKIEVELPGAEVEEKADFPQA